MNNEFAHHGILGQKWGQRNGPPYPLGSGDHSVSERKAGWRKSLNKSNVDSDHTKPAARTVRRELNAAERKSAIEKRRAQEAAINVRELQAKQSKSKNPSKYEDAIRKASTDASYKYELYKKGRDRISELISKAKESGYDVGYSKHNQLVIDGKTWLRDLAKSTALSALTAPFGIAITRYHYPLGAPKWDVKERKPEPKEALPLDKRTSAMVNSLSAIRKPDSAEVSAWKKSMFNGTSSTPAKAKNDSERSSLMEKLDFAKKMYSEAAEKKDSSGAVRALMYANNVMDSLYEHDKKKGYIQ